MTATTSRMTPFGRAQGSSSWRLISPSAWPGRNGRVQIITDGSDPNTAGLVTGYVQGAWHTWLSQRPLEQPGQATPLVTPSRALVQPELESRRFLVPGPSRSILMMIGSLLTALVVAREWERGTMEALLASQSASGELSSASSCQLPAGMGAMAVSVSVTLFVFGIPLRGSIFGAAAHDGVFAVAFGLGFSSRRWRGRSSWQARSRSGRRSCRACTSPASSSSCRACRRRSAPSRARAGALLRPGLQTIFLAGDIARVLVPNSLVLIGMASASWR